MNIPLEQVPTHVLREWIDQLNAELKTRVTEFTLTDLEKHLANGGFKIDAIKAVRNRTHLGLRECKELVDAYNARR